MLDMDRLLELLEKALNGSRSGCSVTAAAYLKLARAEWLRMIDDVPAGEARDAIRAAALFADRMTSRQRSVFRAAQMAYDFWHGFEDGAHERTQPQRGSPAHRRGYKFGRFGS